MMDKRWGVFSASSSWVENTRKKTETDGDSWSSKCLIAHQRPIYIYISRWKAFPVPLSIQTWQSNIRNVDVIATM